MRQRRGPRARTMLGLFVLAFGLGMGLDRAFSRGQDAASADAAHVIRVTAQKFRYEPEEITLELGRPVVLEFLSVDALHGFSLPDLGVRADLLPGQLIRVPLTPSRLGTFQFHCDNFCGAGHEEMSGLVHVVAASGPEPAAGVTVATAPAGGLATPAPVPEGSPVTLAELQRTVLGPRCALCHTGAGTELPAAMDLTSAAASASALIGVDSREAPGLARIRPGDPEHSLLLRKLLGRPGAPGMRMPLGGPFLDEATLAAIETWIKNGASVTP